MNKQLRIVLYGGSGLLGSEILRLLNTKYEIISPSHLELEVTKKTDVKAHLKKIKPDYLIYAVAISSVDQAEKDPKLAYLLNSETPRYLAKLATKMNIPMYYFSTDAVFDGEYSTKPYQEVDSPKPISEYGRSKLSGEQAVLSSSTKNVVLRLIMLYSAVHNKKIDFVRKILESLKEGRTTIGITDQYITPLFVSTAVKALDRIIEQKAFGIYHLASLNQISNYAFAKKIAKNFSYDENLITPTLLKSFLKDKKAHRANYSCLDVSKFETTVGKGILQTVENDLLEFKKQINITDD